MRHINFTKIFKPILGKKTVLLVSGGLDSMVMCDAYRRFFSSVNHSATILHFNHHLRGEESNRDERVVVRYCKQHHLKYLVVHLSIPVKTGIQNYARNLRREKLLELAITHSWEMALTAHHADDQLETILMKMERGSGLGGLKGIQPFSPLTKNLILYRPLLEFSREQLADYAKKYAVNYEEDSSNSKNIYTRNRLRHQVIPKLKKDSPNLLKEFLKQAQRLAKYEVVAIKATRLFLKKNDSWIPFNAYKKLPEEIRFRVLKEKIKVFFKEEFTQSHFNEIESLIGRDRPMQREYGDALFVIHDKKFNFFAKKLAGKSLNLTLKKAGRYILPGLGILSIMKKNKGRWAKDRLCLNAQSIKFPLQVRLPQAGDRFQPFGMKGSKLLSDFFTDRKIPRINRAVTPLLIKGKKIICVLGQEIDESVRVDSFKQPYYEVVWKRESC